MRSRVALLALLLVVLGASQDVASADKGVQRARRFYRRAEAAYSVGRYARALTAYQRAYQAKRLPGLLFNIAQCHRLVGHHEKAERLYRAYLEAVPRTRNRAVVVSLIEEMRAKQRAAAAAQPPTTPSGTGSPPVIAPAVAAAPAPAPASPPWLASERHWPAPATPGGASGTVEEMPLHRRRSLWVGLGLVAVSTVAVGLGFGLGTSTHDPSGSLATVDAR